MSAILSPETSSDFLNYTTRTWMHSIKESLLLINGKINLPTFWTPKLQRLGDSNIMAEILKIYPIYYPAKRNMEKK